MTNDRLPDIGALDWAEIEGLRVRYAVSGAAAGVPVLLTAPWPESIYAFHRVLPRLDALGPLIAVDLPGFGISQSRANVMTPEAMGDFVVAVLRHFDLKRIHVVAPDVGALAVLFAALKHPDLFESLALGAVGTRVSLITGSLKQLMELPPGAFSNIDGTERVKGYLDNAAKVTPAPIIDDFRASNAGRRLEDATQYVRAYLTELAKLEVLLPRIETPVLVIAGRHDATVAPQNNKVLADTLPHTRYVLLEGAHRIWEEAASDYTAELVSWFGGGYREVGAR